MGWQPNRQRLLERELIDDLVSLADTAMYAAKHAGGNQAAPRTFRTPT